MAEPRQDGCVKEQTVDKMQRIVTGISVVEILISLGLLIYGSLTYIGVEEKIEVGEYKTNMKIDRQAFLGPIILVTGLIGMIIGGIGLLAAKKKGIFACIYVIGSLLIAVVCLLIGGIILGGNTANEFKEFVCDRAFDGRIGKDISKDQMFLVDTYMCSDLCPCPTEALAKYSQLYNDKEGKKRFEAVKRYIDDGSPKEDDHTALVFSSSGTTYKKYSKCYQEKLEKKLSEETDEKVKEAYDDFKKDGLKYFQSIEEEYKCGGICEPSLFYVELDVTNGPPESDCITAVTAEDKWENNYGMGALAFITSIVLIFAGIAGVPLCRGNKKKESDDIMSKEYA